MPIRNSGPTRCGDDNKPQPVKRSSERLLTNAVAEAMDVHMDHTGCSFRIIKTNCTAIVSMVRSEAGSNMIMLLV